MKKMLVLSLTLMICLSLVAYDSYMNNTNETLPLSTTPIESELSEISEENPNGESAVSNNSDVKIKLLFDNEEVIVKMYDNPTSRDFLALLPLTLTFEDYAGTEKVSYLERRLSTENAPEGSDPSVGDFTYYSPWGNLAIFYRDFGYASGLIILGNIESGTEILANVNGDFTIRIEKI
jgi:hypothetical protein